MKSPIVMVTPFKTDYYREYANAFHSAGRLKKTLLWKRNGYPGIPEDKVELRPFMGKLAYGAAKLFGRDRGETFRFAMYPEFDRWAAKRVTPGDWVFSSYGYANECFRLARSHGGKTLLDGGNSHPQHFWDLLSSEYRKWNVRAHPVPPFHSKRSIQMMEHVDYVLAPSNFVAQSFLDKGFEEKQILKTFYPVNLPVFKPDPHDRPRDRPFTIVNTGSLSVRKGTPYLLEAFRIIHRAVPDVRFLLTTSVADSLKPIMAKYADLPIEWSPYLSAENLALRLQSADLFILPSLEEGLVRTAIQAMACGLPCVLTPNTGANDYIRESENGSIVPICDAQAIADAALTWWERIQNGHRVDVGNLHDELSPEAFQRRVVSMLGAIDP